MAQTTAQLHQGVGGRRQMLQDIRGHDDVIHILQTLAVQMDDAYGSVTDTGAPFTQFQQLSGDVRERHLITHRRQDESVRAHSPTKVKDSTGAVPIGGKSAGE